MWAPCGRKQGRQPGRGRARPGPRSGGRRGAEVREGSRPPGHWGGLSGRVGVALGRRVAPRWAGGLAGHLASEDTAGILGASAQGTAWPAGSQVTCDAGGGGPGGRGSGWDSEADAFPMPGLWGRSQLPLSHPLSTARGCERGPWPLAAGSLLRARRVAYTGHLQPASLSWTIVSEDSPSPRSAGRHTGRPGRVALCVTALRRRHVLQPLKARPSTSKKFASHVVVVV